MYRIMLKEWAYICIVVKYINCLYYMFNVLDGGKLI